MPVPGTPFPSSEVLYSKGAAVLASLESYMERFVPGSFQVRPFSRMKQTGAESTLTDCSSEPSLE